MAYLFTVIWTIVTACFLASWARHVARLQVYSTVCSQAGTFVCPAAPINCTHLLHCQQSRAIVYVCDSLLSSRIEAGALRNGGVLLFVRVPLLQRVLLQAVRAYRVSHLGRTEMLTDYYYFFTVVFSSKFSTKSVSFLSLSHVQRVATLTCEKQYQK